MEIMPYEEGEESERSDYKSSVPEIASDVEEESHASKSSAAGITGCVQESQCSDSESSDSDIAGDIEAMASLLKLLKVYSSSRFASDQRTNFVH
jgi:hypothetical protein